MKLRPIGYHYWQNIIIPIFLVNLGANLSWGWLSSLRFLFILFIIFFLYYCSYFLIYCSYFLHYCSYLLFPLFLMDNDSNNTALNDFVIADLVLGVAKKVIVCDHEKSWVLYVILSWQKLVVVCEYDKSNFCMWSSHKLIVVCDHEKCWFFMQSWHKLIVVCDYDKSRLFYAI